jgi:pimeloyl-ACP methyl ester carboxylesterase
MIVSANGVELCTEAFGSPAHPAVLLIMGASASMVWWPDGFCAALAEGGRYVIRYDNRDTGRSPAWPPGQPGYSLDDLAGDAIGILDAYGIERAHVAGMSLGGMIAQMLALSRPERVTSLSLLMSSVFGPDNPDLPRCDERVLAHYRSADKLDWSDRAAVVDYMVCGWRLLSGSAHPFDEAAIRAIAEREAARAKNLLSMFNHALLQGGEQWYGKIGRISVPTLVIHGTEDPVLPYPHGVALAREISDARLLSLQGTGHELHKNDWGTIVAAILDHTAAAQGLCPAVTGERQK